MRQRGKCESQHMASRLPERHHFLPRGVQAGEVEIPAMAAEAGRETRQGVQRAESDEESDGCDGEQDCERVRVRNTTY